MVHSRIPTVFDEHFPSDDADDALAVGYLSGEMGVARGVDGFSKHGQHPVNGVLACLFQIRKFSASPILRELSVQVAMKIESWHLSGSRLRGT
jgi:hypothetical protein